MTDEKDLMPEAKSKAYQDKDGIWHDLNDVAVEPQPILDEYREQGAQTGSLGKLKQLEKLAREEEPQTQEQKENDIIKRTDFFVSDHLHLLKEEPAIPVPAQAVVPDRLLEEPAELPPADLVERLGPAAEPDGQSTESCWRWQEGICTLPDNSHCSTCSAFVSDKNPPAPDDEEPRFYLTVKSFKSWIEDEFYPVRKSNDDLKERVAAEPELVTRLRENPELITKGTLTPAAELLTPRHPHGTESIKLAQKWKGMHADQVIDDEKTAAPDEYISDEELSFINIHQEIKALKERVAALEKKEGNRGSDLLGLKTFSIIGFSILALGIAIALLLLYFRPI